MIRYSILLLILSSLLNGCFLFNAPIQTTGDVYVYISVDDRDTPNTETRVDIPWN